MHKNLKALRAKNGFNQKDVAQLLGISLQNYNAKENGKGEFSISEIEKIISLFSLPYEDIFFTTSCHNTKQNETA